MSKLILVTEAEAPTDTQIGQERPYYAVYTKDTVIDGKHFHAGTWYHTLKHSEQDGKSIPIDKRLCDPLHIDAETISSDDGSTGRLLRFTNKHGQLIEWVMPMEMIAGSGEELLRNFYRQGLSVNHDLRRSIPSYVGKEQGTTRILTTTAKTGWHKSGAFVLPNNVIGGNDIRYQDSGKAATIFSSQGSLEAWQKEVAALCVGNPVLILSVCCALAGPLLHKVAVNGGGVHLVGDSSSGKSLAQEVAASVWGHPKTFTASWDISKGGIEIEAASRNDTVFILDEIKRADPNKVQEMAYAIANGMGKSTMTREREGRAKLYWRVLALSSGERSLSEHAAIAGNSAHAGAELRMVDVDAGKRKYKAFDYLHGIADGDSFHKVLTTASVTDYGHAGIAMVKNLLTQTDKNFFITAFSEQRKVFNSKSPQAGRVADRFTVMALAGELAITYGVLPWPTGTAQTACKQLFNEWLSKVGDGNAEDKQISKAILDFIAVHGDSRFSDYDSKYAASHVNNRAGYYLIDKDKYDKDKDKRFYLFNVPALCEAAKGFSQERILNTLEAYDALAMTDKGRRNKEYRLHGGGRARFFVIDPEKLEH